MTTPNPPILGDAHVDAGLLRQAHACAAALARRGIRRGDRLAVDSPETLGWFLGADLLGAATLVVEPSWTPRERDAVLAQVGPHHVVSGSVPPPDGVTVAPQGDGETHFYLPTTSGSGGRPKVLIRTRSSWTLSFTALGDLPGPVLVPGPLSSSLFLFGALHALATGAELHHRPRWSPEHARGAVSVHLVPAMLASLVHELERRPGPCALRTVVCGGAHLAPALRARFTRVLPDAELIEYYGSAEHSLIAIRRGEGDLRPVPGVELRTRDSILWVRSPLTFSGYLRDGALEPAGSGWSTAGDRAELSASGALTVHGRDSTTISSGGKLVAAEEVESVLRDVPGVEDVLVAGTPHPRFGTVVTAIIEAHDPPALARLRAVVRARLEPGKRPRRWLVTSELPRTPSGKAARAVVAEQLGAGTLRSEPLR
ncbi:class I adenylate-forming enzyme family protein [Pseudonocardia spinosispora]|uniref:class I adenylate-forming enzyme family protein n=1 Tax=Pseudonocardia spinosispora TaxID=103441 RepID=UPI0003F85B4C|nr:AMP-binding protein [Pseudonocardia spinosispora]